MSRLIQQPVASVKLTNVATVRLHVAGQRFEIACYKNKILDYRAGLETDVTEVLQTTRIFTNVTAGQFAAASDLQLAFGEAATDEDIAIRILQHGKSSLQVSEAERNALFESTLTQITTWLADNCIHSETGKPYTVSKMKQELTTSGPTVSNGKSDDGKTKKQKKKKKKQSAAHFTVQPHKPIKQQYLQAFKYLRNERGLPIQRAPMEIAWHYSTDTEYDDIVHVLTSLQIPVPRTKESPIRLHIDPSNYRPLHQQAEEDGTRLEIVRQRVDGVVTTKVSTNDTSTNNDDDGEEQVDRSQSDSDNDDYIAPTSQKQKLKNKRRQKNKAQRRLERLVDAESENSKSDDEEEAKASESAVTRARPTQPPPSDGVKRCNTCVGEANAFANAATYRAHFQSDWHRYNQKLKLQGVAPVGLAEFESCDAESFFATVDS